ncbi:MAG: hypothetical protein ACYCY2_02335 [Acidithiobacillus ferriphilus]
MTSIATLERLTKLPRHLWDSDHDAELAEAQAAAEEAAIDAMMRSGGAINEALGYASQDQQAELARIDAKLALELARGHCDETLIGVADLAEKRLEIIREIFRTHPALLEEI